MAGFSGFQGSVTGASLVNGILNTWSASISRSQTDITGFSNAGRNRVLGLWDITGAAGGVQDDTINPTIGMTNATGTTITLIAKNDAAANSIAFNAVVDQVQLGVNKSGDATVSFNFGLASTATVSTAFTELPFTVSWV